MESPEQGVVLKSRRSFAAHPAQSRSLKRFGRATLTGRRDDIVKPPVSANSMIDRWAHLIVELVNAPADPRTLAHWAQHVHISASTLRQVCAAAGVRAKRSLDLARLLRAVVWLEGYDWRPEAVLSCRDLRTLRSLFLRTGCGDGRDPVGADGFFAQQTVLDQDGPHLLALRRAFAKKSSGNPVAFCVDPEQGAN